MPANLFVWNFPKMTPLELISWLLGTAALQEGHPYHGKTMPDWVPAWAQFREHAANLTAALKAAENKDLLKLKELEEERIATLDSIDVNAGYILIRAKQEKDDSLIHGTGYEVKDQTRRARHHKQSVSKDALKVKVKAGPVPGSVSMMIERDPNAGLYQVRICKGQPDGEESFGESLNFKSCRFVIEPLERASWYYFIVRSLGNNETSPWSTPVGIIVV